jgi:hypothetical protein
MTTATMTDSERAHWAGTQDDTVAAEDRQLGDSAELTVYEARQCVYCGERACDLRNGETMHWNGFEYVCSHCDAEDTESSRAA